MQIKQHDLANAVNKGLISAEQAKQLWDFWETENQDVPSFKAVHVMYYFGGLLAISAITLFVTQIWDQLQGLPLFILSSLLFVLGLLLTHYFLKKNLKIPAGIFATFSLAVVPLAIYNLQITFGYHPPQMHYAEYHEIISWYWMPMEFATLLVGVIMLYFYRFPFLLFPIAVTLWYMSMDLAPLFMQQTTYLTWKQKATFSLYFGLLVLLVAVYVDFRNQDERKDYAFWLYIFGVIIFWGGLSSQESTNELGRFIYCLINIFMILISVFLDRRVFAVFGVIGVLMYIGYLSYSVFADSIGFPILLVFLGLLIIFAATRWTRMEEKLTAVLSPYMPRKILNRKKFDK